MKCPKCQFENAEGIKFCGDCGYDLRKAQEPPSDAYIHPQSYTPKFLADKILTTKSAIEGERKLVTVLFADVANYTSMSEKLDPEQVHQIMDGCFKILMDEIHDHEGTINQFTGDGVMALFGAPLALEKHAQRACYAALSIQKAMVEYSKEVKKDFGANFKMRVGLNSGPVVVGSIGDDLRMDYTAIGNTTNLASRMESMAEPGTVLVSIYTYKSVKQHFEFTPLSKETIKGKETPQDVYRLVDKIHRSKISSERMIQSEMVGRQIEMDRLELHVLKAINGEGSIVNIIGEAGLGKSRLIAELKTMSALRRVAVFEGRALSIGRNLSFYPIIEILKNWARIDENDSETESIYKLESAVKNIYPEQADEIFPFIATLMGMKPFGKHAERLKGIEGEALEKLIQKNLRDLIIKASQLSPIIFIIEDLHWADNSSLELMQTLFRLAKDNRILFINVFRPFHKDTGEKLLDSVKEKYPGLHTEIYLKPLDNSQCDLLIDNLLKIKRIPGDMKGLIKKRAEGNPFFIEEVIRSFIDEGIVELKDGEFNITRKIESVVIPSTINELLMSRIDRLDERIKSLVKTASVIGRNFFYKILVEIADTIDDIDDKLGYLKEVQLILERRRMEEIEYLFKHALAQEAAYESILLKKRKELHMKVADSIERVFNKRLHEFYGMLAFHYSRGEEYEKAEEYLIKAGEEALKSSASSEALHYYQEGLNLYLKKYGDAADPEKIALLEKNIAIALFNRGHYDESVKYFEKVLAFYGVKVPKYSILVILKLLSGFINLLLALYFPFLKWKRIPTKRDSEILYLRYKKACALVNIDPKKFLIESLCDVKLFTNFDLTKEEFLVGMFVGYSMIFSWTGISFRLSNKILEFSKGKIIKDDVKSKFLYKVSIGYHNILIGEWGKINPYDDDLVNRMLKTGETRHIAPYMLQIGFLCCERGHFSDALDINNKIYEMANEYDNDFFLAVKYAGKSLILLKYRKLHDAVIETEEGIDFTNKTGIIMQSFTLYSVIARIKIIMGDISGAESYLQHADEIRSDVKVAPFFLSEFLFASFSFDLYQLEKSIKSSNAYELKRKQKKAKRAGKSAVKNSLKVASSRTEAYRLMGIYYWLIKKQKKALKWWSKSIAEGERLGARPELSRTYMEVGKRLFEPKSKFKELNGIKAEGYLEKARSMFEDMDLQWDLNELDKIVQYSQPKTSLN